ncbi:hypothetical protein OHA77_03125 [Streptosporangium sp. NBC_01639]|uniref:hypothetical protein n=1 Tax=Streptosporangium sp. NBC_01639 TaxID=2975948 RepID=UPI003862E401|nr:hypothetical protein OHA77_03125 [Streptosporangium sp. NBC_01639]
MSAITERDQDRLEPERRARRTTEPARITQKAQIILLIGEAPSGRLFGDQVPSASTPKAFALPGSAAQ